MADMTLYLLLNHLLNFMAPAALMALVLVGFSRLFPWFFKLKNGLVPYWPLEIAINFGVGLGVLVAGLVLLGRDGKMLTYVMLVVAMATSQWLQLGRQRH